MRGRSSRGAAVPSPPEQRDYFAQQERRDWLAEAVPILLRLAADRLDERPGTGLAALDEVALEQGLIREGEQVAIWTASTPLRVQCRHHAWLSLARVLLEPSRHSLEPVVLDRWERDAAEVGVETLGRAGRGSFGCLDGPLDAAVAWASQPEQRAAPGNVARALRLAARSFEPSGLVW